MLSKKTTMKHIRTLLAFVGSIALLSSCGGSNDNGSPVVPAQPYHVSGTVGGLHGIALTLKNNGGDAITINNDGPFAFPTPVTGGASYSVSAVTNSTWTTCTVTNGTGTPNSNAANVTVNCGAAPGNGSIVIANLRPWGITVDTGGVIYVTSRSTGGFGSIMTLAPDGTRGGVGGQWLRPITGIATDATGNVYVADTQNSSIKKVTAGNTITPIGSGFQLPYGVTVDRLGNVYVADTGNNAIKKIAVDGTVTTLGAGFNAPQDIKVDSTGILYVADTGNNAIKKVAMNGTVTTLGSGFSGPYGLAVDTAGAVYVADTGNNAVKSIAPDGTVATLATSFLQAGSVVPFSGLQGITLDSKGNLLVTDGNNVGDIIRLVPRN